MDYKKFVSAPTQQRALAIVRQQSAGGKAINEGKQVRRDRARRNVNINLLVKASTFQKIREP